MSPPDVCTLGKIVGGGFPLAAIAGNADLMAHFDVSKVGPEGFLMQLGTLSGNPVASVAGLKTMEILRRDGAYEKIRANGQFIMDALSQSLSSAGHDHQIVGDPTLFDVVFTADPVRDYRSWLNGDAEKNARFNTLLRARGIFKAPGKLYPSLALTEADLQQTREAICRGSGPA